MDAGKVLTYLSYLVSAVFFLGGLFVIFGMFLPSYVPTQFRIMFGIVLMLWGIYRSVITYTKSRQLDNE